MRSLFLSDLHLGSRTCRASELSQFLAGVEVERLFLLGDIVDLWSLRRRAFWPESHNALLSQILAMARRGTRVVLVPGNHDADLRAYAGWKFGNLEVRRQWVHRTAEGRRVLLVHGDEFELPGHRGTRLERLGANAYDLTIDLGRYVNGARQLLGLPHLSLVRFFKQRIALVQRYVRGFEAAMVEAARQQRVDGVVCGHIHRPALVQHDDLLYCNDGDWVENCSALVEEANGSLKLWQLEHAASQRLLTAPTADSLQAAA